MGYTAQLPRPAWPALAPLPREDVFYPFPDSVAWKDPRERRGYRRYRIDRHRQYLLALSWSRSMLGADIRQRMEAGRCSAERAWILDEELTRRFEHRRAHHGLCECEQHFWGPEEWWWPFPEAECEPQPEH